MRENDFEMCLHQPSLVNKWDRVNRIERPIGTSIIDFRINNNGALPTRMRSLFSWNLNSWRTFDSREYKLRRCKQLLKKGPVCLQETKWTGAEIEHLYQQIPGIRVCQSAAVGCRERTRTGGVAILLPPGFEILEELEVVPGRAVAVKVQDRTVYCISILNIVNKMPKPYCEPGGGWTVQINLYSLPEISTVLIPTSRTSGSKFYYSLNVLMLIRH